MKNLNKLIAGTLIMLILTSCSDEEDTIPTCLSNQISDYTEILLNNTCGITTLQINELKFQGKIVYELPYSICFFDGTIPIVNQDCEIIGHLGGFSGNQMINDEEFRLNAEFIRTIWKREI